MSLGRQGNTLLRRWLSARRPWNNPQSKSKVLPQASTWCIEPVTVCVAPQKVTVGSAECLLFLIMECAYWYGRPWARRHDFMITILFDGPSEIGKNPQVGRPTV